MRKMLVKKMLAPALLAGLVLMNLQMGPWYDRLYKRDAAAPTAVSVLLDALGEIRTFIAQTIFLQTDLYHHEMERQGIPWTQEKDLMSMYRMVTLLDPRIVDAYDIASYQLVMNFGRVDEGLVFLDEGIAHNPTSAKLRFEKAFLLESLKRYEEAIPQAGVAMNLLAPDPVALVEGEPKDQIDFLNAVRILATCYERLGNREGEVHARRIILLLRYDDPHSVQRMTALGLPPAGYTREQFYQMLGHSVN